MNEHSHSNEASEPIAQKTGCDNQTRRWKARAKPRVLWEHAWEAGEAGSRNDSGRRDFHSSLQKAAGSAVSHTEGNRSVGNEDKGLSQSPQPALFL